MVTNVLSYLENSARRFPDKPAFVDEHNQVTYQELEVYGSRIGSHLASLLGSVTRSPIVVFVDRSIDSLIAFMGIAYSGNFYVPIDAQMPKRRIELILETLQPIAMLVPEEHRAFAREIGGDIALVSYEEAKAADIDAGYLSQVRRALIDRDPLYATFTSGSTGIPKGVLTCHQSVVDMTENLVSIFNFDDHHVFGNQNPFYFDASIKDIYSSMKCGATMYIIPKSCFTLQKTLIDYINKHKIDTILWSAAAISMLANSSAFEYASPDCLRKVMFSGEVMHNKVLNYWRRHLPETMFVNLYGPTEITSVCTYYIIEQPFDDDDVLPIGIPFKNTEIMLLNDGNERVTAAGEIGELCVRGCCLALGYYNNPEKTADAFCQNPLNSHYPEVIYRTGDLAKYNEKGEILFLSRKDNQVKHMGQRVELGEIEILLNALDRVDASICFYDHEAQKIVAIVKGQNADKKYIFGELRDRLPKAMFPNLIFNLNTLPYNANGKIDRVDLKARYAEGTL